MIMRARAPSGILREEAASYIAEVVGARCLGAGAHCDSGVLSVASAFELRNSMLALSSQHHATMRSQSHQQTERTTAFARTAFAHFNPCDCS